MTKIFENDIILNATVQDGKITLDINDLLKLIQQDKITGVEYKVEQKPMAFDTKKELDEYVKENPNATLEGLPTHDLVQFIYQNKGKYLFLKRANLSGAYLIGANFSGADLSDANLSGAYFGGANFSGANLRCADLIGADLRCADLRCADLRGADLIDAYLRCADLSGAYLGGADLSGANLIGADLSDADLRCADLRGANLRGAKYNDKTTFSAFFTIPTIMIKI